MEDPEHFLGKLFSTKEGRDFRKQKREVKLTEFKKRKEAKTEQIKAKTEGQRIQNVAFEREASKPEPKKKNYTGYYVAGTVLLIIIIFTVVFIIKKKGSLKLKS